MASTSTTVPFLSAFPFIGTAAPGLRAQPPQAGSRPQLTDRCSSPTARALARAVSIRGTLTGSDARGGSSRAHLYRADVPPDRASTPTVRSTVSDVQQLVQASRLYYELGETQSRVAELLGVTRPQVSRLLKRARAEGIVEIRIVDQASADVARRRRAATPVRTGGGPPRAAPRRARGGRPADGRPARRRRAAVARSATARSWASAMVRRSRPWRTLAATSRSTRPAPRSCRCAAGTGSRGPAREPFRRVADGIGGVPLGLLAPGPRRRSRRRRRRSAPMPASAGSSTSGIGSRSRRSGSAGRPGARPRSAPTWRASSTGPAPWGRCSSSPFDLDGRLVVLRPARSDDRVRRCASSAGSRSGSASPAGRRRSARSSARCGRAASRRS